MSSPRVVSLCPGVIGEIMECWEPHQFRDAIKRAKKAFKPLEHLAAVMVRIDLVIDKKPLSSAKETLLEIREEVADYIMRNPEGNEAPTHFKMHQKHLRILESKNHFPKSEKPKPIEKKTAAEILDINKEVIEKNITVQIFEETKRDKSETARRLGITKGLLMQRLIRYGAYP
jgi:DNA-binding NtrC family response regulator